MVSDRPRTLLQRVEYEGEPIKGSRFIVLAGPVESESAAQDLLAQARALRPDAGHHCSAWRLSVPAIDRANDDGEPGGSAGRPMLAQLTGLNLVNVAAIVSRYWGGTKLGVGGLMRAYGGAVGAALGDAPTVPWRLLTEVSFDHGYPEADLVERLVAHHGGRLVNSNFGARVVRVVSVAAEDVPALEAALGDASSGRITFDRK